MQFEKVGAHVIKDSRGQETIEVSVNGEKASSPSGKIANQHEAKEYYQDLKTCVAFLHGWNEKITVKSFKDLEKVESFIKQKLEISDIKLFGSNVLYALESAILKALAKDQGREVWQVINSRAKKFPRPMGNAICGSNENGKEHPMFQEFLLIPKEKTFAASVEMMTDVYNQLGRILRVMETNGEGAWHVPLHDERVLESLDAFASAVDFGVDVAANNFYKHDLYDYKIVEYTKEAQIEQIATLAKRYHLIYVEDPLHAEDFQGFAELKKIISDTLIAGDDLTMDTLDRIKKAVAEKAISAVVIKPSQIGSLLDVKKIVDFCKKHKLATVFSHRSGETMDDVLADYAFGFQAGFIKSGITTPWRVCKLQRMIDIEKSLNRQI